MRIAIVLAAVACVAGSACTQQRSARCKQTCTREYECTTQTSSQVPFDEKECITACAQLEADPQSVLKVQKHEECVARHTQCADVLECR